MRAILTTLLATAAACHPASPAPGHPDDQPDAGTVATPDAPDGSCAAGLAGAPCVLALYDRTVADCSLLVKLRGELDARAGMGPLWAAGRGLFRTPLAVAGGWNAWSTTALVGAPVCGSDLVVAVGSVATGRWPYKLVDTSSNWSLDATNPAFAYDDFAGNADGKNSVIDTPDSGLGHIVTFGQECSASLGDCREVTAYLPAGYDAPGNGAKTYPVLFMHDGQNLWDDHTCCFGHTGWEINVALDAEIAAGKVAPIVVIGAASTVARNNQYGLDATTTEAFIQFQVMQLQPHALAHVRGDGQRVRIAGSSLGGLMAMELGLRYPSIYAAAASLSGAFWPGQDTHTALRDLLPTYGKQAVAVYLDHGGDPATNADGAADTIEVRNMMSGMGWVEADSPTCVPGPNALCYHAEPGATHDELAWKARAWRFLEFLFPAS